MINLNRCKPYRLHLMIHSYLTQTCFWKELIFCDAYMISLLNRDSNTNVCVVRQKHSDFSIQIFVNFWYSLLYLSKAISKQVFFLMYQFSNDKKKKKEKKAGIIFLQEGKWHYSITEKFTWQQRKDIYLKLNRS